MHARKVTLMFKSVKILSQNRFPNKKQMQIRQKNYFNLFSKKFVKFSSESDGLRVTPPVEMRSFYVGRGRRGDVPQLSVIMSELKFDWQNQISD